MSQTTLTTRQDAARIEIYRPGLEKPLLTQNAEADKRPYIHPILAPDGDGEITENAPGHHLWQHGLYVGLNRVNGFGFWTEGLDGNPNDGTFHPAPLAPPVADGPRVHWRVETEYSAPSGEPLLHETQAWTLEDRGETLRLEAAWSLRGLTDIEFAAYPYNGLFLRMPWRRETHGDVLTSEGFDTNQTAEAQRARWVAVAMPIPGRRSPDWAGFVYGDHPDNPEFPNPWRVDGNLGLAPSRSIGGGWRLARGEVTTNRYLLTAFIGRVDGAFAEREWAQWAGRAVVKSAA